MVIQKETLVNGMKGRDIRMNELIAFQENQLTCRLSKVGSRGQTLFEVPFSNVELGVCSKPLESFFESIEDVNELLKTYVKVVNKDVGRMKSAGSVMKETEATLLP